MRHARVTRAHVCIQYVYNTRCICIIIFSTPVIRGLVILFCHQYYPTECFINLPCGISAFSVLLSQRYSAVLLSDVEVFMYDNKSFSFVILDSILNFVVILFYLK